MLALAAIASFAAVGDAAMAAARGPARGGRGRASDTSAHSPAATSANAEERSSPGGLMAMMRVLMDQNSELVHTVQVLTRKVDTLKALTASFMTPIGAREAVFKFIAYHDPFFR